MIIVFQEKIVGLVLFMKKKRGIKSRGIIIGSISIIVVLLLSNFSAIPVQEDMKITKSLIFENLIIQEQDMSTTLSLDGADTLFLKENYYVLPTTTFTYTFPLGTQISKIWCETKQIHHQELTYDVAITPSFESLNTQEEEAQIKQTQQVQCIQSWIKYSIGCGLVDSTRCIIVNVQVFPIQYNPLTKTITWAESIDLHIEYQEPQDPITISAMVEDYDLLIISPQDFINQLQPLAAHKDAKGVVTKLVSLDDIYSGLYFETMGRDNSEHIKYFIKNAIEEWDITNVLLIGGSELLPVRMSHLEVTDEGEVYYCHMVSDLYYADIYTSDLSFSSWDTNQNDVFGEYDWNGEFDDLDLHPDVHLGRLPCNDEDELAVVIQKIIAYETQEAYTKDWFTTFVGIGGDSAPDDEEGVDEGEFATQKAFEIMDGFIPVALWASNNDLSSRNKISDELNNGAGFVYFSGHGHRTIWATHPHDRHNIWLPPGNYRSQDVQELQNQDKLPIVILDACYVGQFDMEENCFSWSFLKNPTGGAIGVFSSTYTSYFYSTSYVIEDLIGKLAQDTIKSYVLDTSQSLGEMWTNSINRYISPEMDGADYFTIEEWLLMGDPTLQIRDPSLPPDKPILTGPSSGKVGEEVVFEVVTEDSDSAHVFYRFDWGNNQYTDWIGPYASGEQVTSTHTWDEEGSYQIRVMAKDDHGSQSQWSDPLDISLPKHRSLHSFIEFRLDFIRQYLRFFI